MARKKKPLGRLLLEAMNDITDLIAATTDPNRIKELLAQYNKLREQLADLVDANLDQESDEYKAAVEGMAEASRHIREAIKGMESVAEAIRFIAQAIELIAQLV